MRAPIFFVIFGLSAPAAADTVVLQDGATYDGRVTVMDDGVRVELDFGTVTFDRSMVKEVRRSRSKLDVFEDRRAEAEGDVEALMRLAAWAERHGLERRARDVYRDVIRLAPDHAEARAALGYERVDGRWLTAAEANRAKGLVLYGGTWLTPEEVAARERAQADLRARLAGERTERIRVEAARAEAEAERARAAAVEFERYDWGYGYGWSGQPWWPRPQRPSLRPGRKRPGANVAPRGVSSRPQPRHQVGHVQRRSTGPRRVIQGMSRTTRSVSPAGRGAPPPRAP